MLRLNLWNDAETSQYTVDLYDHAPVNLNYQFTDVSEINKTAGSYSQTFRVPATKSNTDFFGAIFDPNIYTANTGLINGNYDIKRKIRAELLYKSIPLMRGYVQVKAVYVQKKDFADIELVFFGETVDMAKSIGDKMLSDLKTLTIDHDLNHTSVTTSWAGVSAAPFDGTIRYGIMDKGRNWKTIAGDNNTPSSPVFNINDGLWNGDLTPYIQAKWLFAQILDEAGYTYESSFIDGTDFEDVYIPGFNGSLIPVSKDTDPEGELAAAGMAADITVSSSPTPVVLPLLDTVTGGFDYGNNWDNTNYMYEAPFICVPTFTLNRSSTSHISGLEYVIFKVYYLEAGQMVGLKIFTFFGTGQDVFQYPLFTGDKIYVTAEKAVNAPGGTWEVFSSEVGGDGTWLRTDDVTQPLSDSEIGMDQNFPVIKQIDFLSTLQKMFNLVFVPDKRKPNHLIIEPFKDYTETGTTKDWTNKIDFTKDVVIKPTSDIQAKQYDWSYDKGQDFINVFVQDSVGRTYGRHRVTDPANDFASGEKKIETKFAPYLISLIPGSNFQAHRCIDKDGNGVKKPKPRIAFWNGLVSEFGTWYLRDDSGDEEPYTTFPFFSNYNDVAPTIGDEDLNFGYEPAFVHMEAHPLNTLFYKYWTNYVNELYSNEARFFTGYFNLTRADIQDFEFSDKIYIKDSFYRILKISNFDATQGGSVQVELLKVLSDIADCAFIPSFVNSVGQIRFTGGDPIEFGNKNCCERYGYIWRPRLGRCYPVGQEIQPT